MEHAYGHPELPHPAVHILDGSQYPLSRAGLAAAIDELPAGGGVVLQPPGCPLRFESADPVLILRDNISLIGHPSSPISGPLRGDCVMISPYGEQGPGCRLKRDANRSDTFIELDGEAGLVVGDTLLLRDHRDGHSHVSIVIARAQTGVSFADPLSDGFSAATSEAFKLTVRKHLDVRLWLDGSGCEGSVTGFGANYTQFSNFDVTASNFSTRNSCGAYDNYGYGNQLRGLFVNCGNADNARGFSSSAVEVMHSTRATVRDVRIVHSRGFGFSTGFTNHSLFDNIATSYTVGHGMKVGGSTLGSQCADLRISNCAISYVGIEPSSGTGESGLCYTAGSHDIVETNCVVQNCGWHGVEIYDDDVCRILSTNLRSENNGLVNPGVDIATWGHGHQYHAAQYSTRIDRAIGTLWDGAFSEGETSPATAGETVVFRKRLAGGSLGTHRCLSLFMAASLQNGTSAGAEITIAVKFGDETIVRQTLRDLTPDAAGRTVVVQATVENQGAANRQVATLDCRVSAAEDTVSPTAVGPAMGFGNVDTTLHQELSVIVTLQGPDGQLTLQPEACRLAMIG